MIAVTGYGTTIMQELRKLLSDEEMFRIESRHGVHEDALFTLNDALLAGCSRFVLAAGVLTGQGLLDQCKADIALGLETNLILPMFLCESILQVNPTARICVVGSESGFSWSYDDVYAAAKAGIHRYVMTKKVKPTQQIFAVAPTIISNSGMTEARKDYPEILEKRQTVTAMQVAQTIRSHLYKEEIASNFVDRILC